MADFKKHGFKHHPAIALELVKFLAVNTSCEIIERLKVKVRTMEKDIAKLKKVMAGSVKLAGLAGNTVDSLKPTITKLDVCLAKLETKVF
jgi:hypothetical protein